MKSKYICISIIALFFIGCDDVLDKTNLNVLGDDQVFVDETLAQAYVDARYAENLPDPDAFISGGSDESPGNAFNSLFGQLTVDNTTDIWESSYGQIRRLNIGIEGIAEGTLDQDAKDALTGPLLFFRAWRYWNLVRLYGGVPLVTNVQDREVDDLFVSRATTSAGITQIAEDLDAAAALLPNTDIEGRLTKGVAMAVKGRVLLYYASEQFSPDGNLQRWQDAYNANKTAMNQLIDNEGKALHTGEYANIWFDEDNSEAVFYTKYQNGSSRTQNWDACTRPLEESGNCTGANQPTWGFVQSYLMKNGLPITDPASGYNPDAYWLNRDPRFGATIVVNGAIYELTGKTERRQWTFTGGEANGSTATGFYCRKAIDTSLDPFQAQQSGTDWLELRFTEVLMNVAETANEIGNGSEALDILIQIRDRAGLDPGADSRYGLTAGLESDVNAMRDAIMYERKIEFAFEGKRFWDLKRRRMFESELNGTRREGLSIMLKAGITLDILQNLSQSDFDNNYTTYFDEAVRQLDVEFSIDFKDDYYFLPISKNRLEENQNIIQTNVWGGTFDPLQ